MTKITETAHPFILQLKSTWDAIDEIVMDNQAKVLKAFVDEKVSAIDLHPSTGYGYGDGGRDKLEKVYARVFGAEDALVRTHWSSGTHALKTALFGMLRPKDEIVSLTGLPYDTLLPVIGLTSGGDGSLKDFGISFKKSDALTDCVEGRKTPSDAIEELKTVTGRKTALFYIQRSRGYSDKKTVSIENLKEFIPLLKETYPDVKIMVDNCYCEFVENLEPTALGVDLAVGSLIKNPGGGIAATGGYAVGMKKSVEKVAQSLYAPGLGGDVGSNPQGHREYYQGLFLAPKIVGEALKGATFAALYFQSLGFKSYPGPFEKRSDIVQVIETKSPEALLTIGRAIQSASPVDSFATPEPWDMPGYDHKVIMAAGTFVEGSSIELSCDGPFIPPFRAYLQGGLTKEHVIIACIEAGWALKASAH